MENVILFLIVFIMGYICFVVIVLVLGKLFFPFFTNEELAEKRRLALLK
jgi:ABC-type transporter Mla subunit MlaD